MDWATIIQIVSVVGVGLLVALAWWARIARPTPPLDEARAREILAVEFPDDPVEALWIAADGEGAVGRAQGRALVIYRAGDGYVARSLPWDQALASPVRGGRVRFSFHDIAAPAALLAVSGVNPWPPGAHDERVRGATGVGEAATA